MIKEAVVKVGSTPSVEDGSPCKEVINGEPTCGFSKEASEELTKNFQKALSIPAVEVKPKA